MNSLSPSPAHPAPEVLLRRGGVLESRHRVCVAVVDPSGHVRRGLGDWVEPVFFRSAAKLFQALPLIEDGGVEHFGLSEDEIAVTCGSHGGEPFHVATVTRLLHKVGLTPDALACGPQVPMHRPSATALHRAGEVPGRIHNNCSGKHAGMLALACLHGWPVEGYLNPDHPVQQRVRTTLAEWTGLAPESFLEGGDGCGVPTFAAPLPVLALGFARWFQAALHPRGAGRMDRAPARILQALQAHPEQLAGTGRLCTALMAGGGDRLVVKLGAEGVYGAAIQREGEVLGLAIKVPDGGRRAAEVALIHALIALDPSLLQVSGLVAPLSSESGGWRQPAVPDTLGAPVAHLEGVGFETLAHLLPPPDRYLPPGLRALVRVAAAQGARDAQGVERELTEALVQVQSQDLTPRAVEEALLQSVLFLGYPAALEGMERWRRISGADAPSTADPRGRTAWSMQGARLLGQVYGSQAPVVRDRMAGIHPDLAAWMMEEGYGKVLSRPGLPVTERELLNCALLAVQDAPRQLYSHLRGALLVGASSSDIAAVLREVDGWIASAEARNRVYDTWTRVQEAWMRHANRRSQEDER